MALKQNKTSMAAAIAAAAGNPPIPPTKTERANAALPRGTIASVRVGAGGIQDIDTSLILPWGPKDRLGIELTPVNSEAEPTVDSAVLELAESIKDAGGQQVPVLLRPSEDVDGHFEVIYGRRRILACQHLNQPVRALVRTLDDKEALQAKGLENSSRVDLSYYERARFAREILNQGYDRSEAITALAISKNTLSQLERVTNDIPDDLGDMIGPAPKSGRPKWTALADALRKGVITAEKAKKLLQTLNVANSDDRLTRLLSSLTLKKKAQEVRPAPDVVIKTSNSAVNMTIKRAGDNEAYTSWLSDNLGQIIQDSYERFKESAEE
ncbi:Chromosome-partitioning protein ParB [Ruegeria denitrificans]|uniref:Chromosome-partitioning protein ParB n=1 Tax=Ruegeria denitrificans TaxID=1715692 RepID=A0A0P1I945_9RHOB|nr:plasmid partitioning protein RepB [Ruegeria denitrificans]CUJ98563.1 Chromosome-partitioning protein ParB [Ruegeria denitrificans]